MTLTIPLLVGCVILAVLLRETRVQLVQAEARAQALQELAHRDPLTGLHNRRALDHDLARLAGTDQAELLALIDIDGLKRVNDTLGHAAGDDLLRRFAAGLSQRIQGERAYRLSGDEFALLLGGRTPEEAVRLVAEVTDEVQRTYPQAGASMGTARWMDGECADTWLSRADQAMYGEKRRLSSRARSSL